MLDCIFVSPLNLDAFQDFIVYCTQCDVPIYVFLTEGSRISMCFTIYMMD